MATQRELDTLAKIYLAARDQLLDTIINSPGVGTKTFANTILQQLDRELKRLQAASDKYIETAIPAEYEKGLDAIYQYFKKNNLTMKHPSHFADLHTDAIYTIAREMQHNIRGGLVQVGRQLAQYVNTARDEVLRSTALMAAGEKLATGGTVLQMKNNLTKKLQEQGFMTVQYGSGPGARNVPIDAYAMLCARSTTREAGNLARENQLTANGYDLVEMTEHYPTCDVCAPLQGRVYSISGKDKRFPPLSRAFSSGYHNVHPNCRHSIVPWIEELQTGEEVQQAMAKSQAPFTDSRSKQEVELYNKQQRENRQLREDLYQYERYKARLGNDAPETFHAFRRMKKADDETWQLMEFDYKRRNDLVLHPEKALPNAKSATAASEKFSGYLFRPQNPVGWAKGIAFTSRLGYNGDNWGDLREQVLKRAQLYPATLKRVDGFGQRYEQRMVLQGKKKTPAHVVVGWNVNGDKTHLTTLYISEVK